MYGQYIKHPFNNEVVLFNERMYPGLKCNSYLLHLSKSSD